jgi:PAS domain-containing protein
MKNLLDSTEIPTIFLDRELNVKRFTSHATKVLPLIPSDIGRPIRHIVSNLKHGNPAKDAEEVLKKPALKELEVEAKDGHWYSMRILPYRTADNVIDGVVVSFLDIHDRKTVSSKIESLNQSLQEARDFAEGIIATLREPLLVLNEDLRVISANRSFYRTFEAHPESTEGQFIFDLGNRQWDIPGLRELLEKIIPENNVFEAYAVEHTFPTIGFRKMLLNARKIAPGKSGKALILLAIEDVTEKRA